MREEDARGRERERLVEGNTKNEIRVDCKRVNLGGLDGIDSDNTAG